LTGPLLPSCPSFFKVVYWLRKFHLDISHMYVLYFNEINPLYDLTVSLSPCSPIIQQLSVHFIMLSSYRDAMYFLYCCIGDTLYFDIIHSLSFSFSLLLPHSPLKQVLEKMLENRLTG
jgi:hypothetical protein